jgi:hypothetical protein
MRIREYTPADLDALRRMHASQGFDYAFPDLSDPIFISKLIVEDDSGRPVMASLARLTCEMYLLIDRIADAGPNACHSERSPVLFSSRGLCAAWSEGLPGRRLVDPGRSVVKESLFDVGSENALTPREIPLFARNDNSDGGGRAGNARTRWAQLLALHRAGEQDLLARGLDDAHAWLPPQIARRFGRRLESLGWLRDDTWTPYCKRLKTTG